MLEACVSDWISAEGAPLPLGVSWVAEREAYNFSIYSKHAESVTLLLYAEADLVNPVLIHKFYYLRNKTGRVWHCIIPGATLKDVRYYAYSIDGPPPGGPFEFHRFDPEKILLDPYARTIYIPPSFVRAAAILPGSNAGKAPLAVLQSGKPETPPERCVRRHESETVIYELHVRGFTQNENSGVTAESRGKYAGVIEKIPYLKELGVTIVELMPVYQFDPSGGDVWGYSP